MTQRQLGNTGTGLLSACVSAYVINVLFVTVSNYINELFIIKVHTDRLTSKDRACAVSVCKGNVDVRGKFHRQTFISASFMFMYTV